MAETHIDLLIAFRNPVQREGFTVIHAGMMMLVRYSGNIGNGSWDSVQCEYVLPPNCARLSRSMEWCAYRTGRRRECSSSIRTAPSDARTWELRAVIRVALLALLSDPMRIVFRNPAMETAVYEQQPHSVSRRPHRHDQRQRQVQRQWTAETTRRRMSPSQKRSVRSPIRASSRFRPAVSACLSCVMGRCRCLATRNSPTPRRTAVGWRNSFP